MTRRKAERRLAIHLRYPRDASQDELATIGRITDAAGKRQIGRVLFDALVLGAREMIRMQQTFGEVPPGMTDDLRAEPDVGPLATLERNKLSATTSPSVAIAPQSASLSSPSNPEPEAPVLPPEPDYFARLAKFSSASR